MGNLSQHEIDAMLLGTFIQKQEGKVVLETSAPDEGQTENSNYMHTMWRIPIWTSFKEDIPTYFNDSEMTPLGS